MQNNLDLYSFVLKNSDIVKVISKYIPLEKRGKNFVCLCPFHDDKTLGNFYVSENKQIYKCFSCGSSGNSITFVKEYLHVNTYDAYKIISEICGFDLPKDINYNKQNKDFEKIYSILEEICKFYESNLFLSNEGRNALLYLHNRGLDDETIRKFRIGYSLKDGKIIIDYLIKKGYSLKDISRSGITSLNSDPFDKNAGRISFPIENLDGKICGFSCRAITTEKVEKKYINTTSTEVFNKSTILYNYHNALNDIRKKNSVYIFEGFMDVIAAYRVGFVNSIGLMGTSFTIDHLNTLKKLNITINLCLDLDDPGQEAMFNISNNLEKYAFSYKLVNNKVNFSYKDSDEILFHLGDKVLINFLSSLIDRSEWLLNYFSKKYDLSLYDNKIKLLNSFSPIISKCKEQIEYENFLNSLKYVTNFSISALDEFYKKRLTLSFNNPSSSEKMNKNITLSNSKNNYYLIEQELIKYSMFNIETINIIKDMGDNFFPDNEYNKIFKLLIEYYDQSKFVNATLENFIEFTNSKNELSSNDKDLIIANIKKIYELRLYNSYSSELIHDLIQSLNFKIEINNKKIMRQKLINGSNEFNDSILLGAIISSKKNECDYREEELKKKDK